MACYLRHNALHWWCGIAFVSEAVALNPLHFADASYLLGRILNQCSLPEQSQHYVVPTLPHCVGPHCHTVGGSHCHTVGPHSQVCYSGKFSPSLACLQSSSTRTAAVSVIKADRNQRGNNFLISKSDQDSIGRQKRQGWHFVASPSLSKCSEPSLPQMPHFRFSIPCAQYHAIPRNTTQYQFCLRRASSGTQGKEGEGGIEQRRGEDKRVKSSMEVFFNNVSVKVAVKKSWIWPEFEQSRNRYRERSCAISGKAIKVELRSIQQMNFTHSAPWPYSH